MIATFMITLCALAIALYVQAWLAARQIRRHRAADAKAITSLWLARVYPGDKRKKQP